MNYEIVKGTGRTMWLVVDEDGEAMRFYSRRECETWIARAERAAIEQAENARLDRVRRLEIAREYLARRAARPAAPVQLALFA